MTGFNTNHYKVINCKGGLCCNNDFTFSFTIRQGEILRDGLVLLDVNKKQKDGNYEDPAVAALKASSLAYVVEVTNSSTGDAVSKTSVAISSLLDGVGNLSADHSYASDREVTISIEDKKEAKRLLGSLPQIMVFADIR